MPSNARARRFCFTVNASEALLTAWTQNIEQIKGQPKFRYLIGQLERCPTSGKQHFQGYLELTGSTALSTAKAMLGLSLVKPHVEAARGSAQQCIDYCSKQNTRDPKNPGRIEFGVPSAPGCRNDLHNLGAEIVSGKRKLTDIASEEPGLYVRYARGLTSLTMMFSAPRPAHPREVLWYYGPTGTGKTRKAYEENPDAYIWGPENKHWFNGYTDERVAIFDEFRGQLPMGMMLRLLDAYPMRVEVKGGFVNWMADKIIITSPKAPSEVYVDDGNDKISQFLRRINKIEYFGDVLADSCPTPLPPRNLSAQFEDA